MKSASIRKWCCVLFFGMLTLPGILGCGKTAKNINPGEEQFQESKGHSNDGQLQSGKEKIDFADGKLYAVAYLGYEQMEDISYYKETYLDGKEPSVFHFSSGEFYLVIPKYSDMEVSIYRNELETDEKRLVYKAAQTEPFIVQCNVSDIFSDITISLSRGEEQASFSPYLSLEDGKVRAGEKGLDITK